MKKFLLLIGIVALIGILAACGGNDDASGSNGSGEGESQLAAGETAYQQSCMACHGADLQGASGPGLKGMDYSKEELVDIIKNGTGMMPGNTAPGKEEAIAEYLLSQQ